MNIIRKISGKNNKKTLPKRPAGAGTMRLFDIGNRLLVVLIIGLLGYVLIKYFSTGENTDLTFPGDEVIVEKVSSSALTVDKPKPFELYARALEARDLFQPIRDRLKPETPALKKALPALHKRIKLIGILLDGDSKVIVEDLKAKQTHFLSRGESIGAVFLEEIREDKVIFMYNDQRVEMTL
ncbi:MAG: hypothetical protein KAS66_05795 [Candidatus Omnitrophica bacterium]|nr:hypothetical protein [Candidatus Omnitrophota bacterium]